MEDFKKLTKPTHCFCEIPNEELEPWVIKRYVEHIDTMTLLQSTTDPHTKEIITIVALLDVDEALMLEMMAKVDRTQQHIIQCRENVKKMLGLA